MSAFARRPRASWTARFRGARALGVPAHAVRSTTTSAFSRCNRQLSILILLRGAQCRLTIAFSICNALPSMMTLRPGTINADFLRSNPYDST